MAISLIQIQIRTANENDLALTLTHHLIFRKAVSIQSPSHSLLREEATGLKWTC